MDDGEDDRNRQIMLDTSIILPIAVAGGITLLIIVFVYCCRHYQSSMLGSRDRGFCGRSYENSTTDVTQRRSSGCTRRIMGRRTTTSNGNANLVQNCMPWSSGRGYYQRNCVAADQQPHQQLRTDVLSRTNYNSTQSTATVGQMERQNGRNSTTNGDNGSGAATPSAPPQFHGDAPPPYSDAILYATLTKTKNIHHNTAKSGNRLQQQQTPSAENPSAENQLNAPPPPYSQNTD